MVMIIDLTEPEKELIREMADASPESWIHFDPPFIQKDIDRLFRRNLLERRYTGRLREYRWVCPARTRHELIALAHQS